MWLLDELLKYKDSVNLAMINREQSLDYKNLWSKSEAISGWLKHNEKKFHIFDYHTPVVIYGNKEIDILPCMHASLKCGVAYVPVDTSYPVERLLKIIKQVNAYVVFNFSDVKIDIDATVVNQSDLNRIYIKYNDYKSDKADWVKDDDICYILFTSGSTGEPKGVPIKKKNIVNFMDWIQRFLPDDKTQYTVMNQVSYSFDVSLIPLYVFLSKGKTLYNFDKEMLSNLPELFENLRRSKLSVWISTPAFLEICCHDDSFNEKLMPNLERIIVAGEILTKTLVFEIKKRFPQVTIINGYGPTECTVLLSACTITDEMLQSDLPLPIGRLIDDAKFELLDLHKENGHNIGELAVISKSVSDGYYNNMEKTKECFWYDSLKQQHGYKTGDLVYFNHELLYYVGRKDNQIKLNGYRIELGDISENINKLPYISNNIVLPIKKNDKIEYLMDVYSLKEDLSESNLKLTIRLKNDLGKLIPSYMIPRKFVRVNEFPLNVNGKIDRKKLLEDLK